MELFAQLNSAEGITVVLVTHEADVARFAQRLVHFVDGRIDFDGPTAQFPALAAAST
jgi:putative ABC transport system ATP-binding protein